MADVDDPDRISPYVVSQPQPIEKSSHTTSSQGIDDPWKLKIILTLDGGGVKGYGSLLMLQALMDKIHELEQEEAHDSSVHSSSFDPYPQPEKKIRSHTVSRSNSDRGGDRTPTRKETIGQGVSQTLSFPKRAKGEVVFPEEKLKPAYLGYLPCHYFDYIGGTSTGGLNAIMLGRLRMRVDQCIGNYPSMARKIFGRARRQIKGWPKSKYDAKNLEQAIQDLVSIRTEKIEKDYLKEFESPDDLCRTFVVSKKLDLDGNGESLYIFRSYDNHQCHARLWPNNPGTASQDDIWKVGRATAAAPTIFKAIRIGDDLFSDGGILYNNPAEVGYSEVLHKEGYYSSNEYNRTTPICLFLSIGTGGDDMNRLPEDPTADPPRAKERKRAKKKPGLFGHLRNLGDKLKKEATKGEDVDVRMRTKSEVENWRYVRWTGGKNLAKLKLDKWEQQTGSKQSTQTDIESWIRTYMSDPIRVGEIEQIAKILVDVRRRRAGYEEGDRYQRYTYCSRLSACPNCGTNHHEHTGTRAQMAKHMKEEHDIPMDTSAFSRFAPKVTGGPF